MNVLLGNADLRPGHSTAGGIWPEDQLAKALFVAMFANKAMVYIYGYLWYLYLVSKSA